MYLTISESFTFICHISAHDGKVGTLCAKIDANFPEVVVVTWENVHVNSPRVELILQ